MSLNIEDSRADLIIKISTLIDQKIAGPEAVLIKDFLAQYYLGVSPYDLREKTLDELYGALLSQWNFLYQRKPGESKLRVYNPQLEQHGWQSSHTIIEIVHENKPFLLDSIRLALNSLDLNVRIIISALGVHFERDAAGKVTKVLPLDMHEKYKTKKEREISEAAIYIEIDRQSDQVRLQKIAATLNDVLDDVDLMVRDWSKMLARMTETIAALETISSETSENIKEVIAFLRWIVDDHFTFIGFAEYNLVTSEAGTEILEYVPNSALGVLSNKKLPSLTRSLDQMYPTAKEAILGEERLLLGKTDSPSTVHRPTYTDFIAVKIYDAEGKLTKFMRFVGLYTSTVYNVSVESIPYIRKKIARIFNMAAFPKSSHDGKTLLHIIETLPRDELLQALDTELFEFAIGILHLQERLRIRLFMRRDIYGRFFSCMVFVPKDLVNSQLRNKMQHILMQTLSGISVTFDTKFSESVLARIHFIVRVNQTQQIQYDVNALEAKLIDAARGWADDLSFELNDYYGEEKANDLYKIYANAFPVSYREIFPAQVAVIDIEHMENLKKESPDYLELTLYRQIEDPADLFRFKLFRQNQTIPLSDIVPILENMGLRIISERSHEIKMDNNSIIWINDYRMVHAKAEHLQLEEVKENFQEAFQAIWHNEAESDGFNRLILEAGLTWRDISILRAFCRYLWQTGLVFSQNYVEDALSNNTELVLKLIEFFYVKFDPLLQYSDRNPKLNDLKRSINEGLEGVAVLNEDRIIRSYLGVLEATVRTNYFQQDSQGWHKDYLAFKIDSAKVPDLPLPRPVCEIFVYSPKVEGIHLRGDRIARGGIRWSDRREDFRTEVLGLMKAQQVKNAVIVPLGAKGGFVVKQDLQEVSDRAIRQQIVIDAYKTLISGLLSLTDNYEDGGVIKPPNTLCWDQDDPYLVVAADKGTATFSDIANDLSKADKFWLGDAFASGGSTGYDHKKMAITARGAWESVKLHFMRLGVDLHNEVITVIGIGDMSGDVFGNGMLLSDKIQLLAAFNHMHIFFDPNPDPLISFNERKRLYDLPGSLWSDYNPQLISNGGGVFSRSAKKITLSPEMQHVLETNLEAMEPNELIRAILKLKVDLFFNGGIGTFVKANFERNADVGDRFNDAIRIDGNEVNARVVCEGGNLGFTQMGRIEYAKKGGSINTDAIDNSGGVNCSDVEVNIKILLDALVRAGDMTEKQRNELLVNMSKQVTSLVLANNRKQNETLTLSDYMAEDNLQMHNRLQKELIMDAGLDPVVEYLPSGEEISLRIAAKQGFTRPELAVLMAYTKNYLKKRLIDSSLPDEKYVEKELINYFPRELHNERYIPQIKKHRLKRAIVATQIANFIVNEMGINFMQRLSEESGADIPHLARAYMIAREVFDVKNILKQIHNLGGSSKIETQLEMWQDVNRLIRRATRWFARNLHGDMEIDVAIIRYKDNVLLVQQNLDKVLQGSWLEQFNAATQHLISDNVPEPLAKIVAGSTSMFTALDIVEAALENNYDVLEVANIYFAVGSTLKLGWFGEMIKKQPVRSYWEALARAGFRDDVDKQQRNLAISILSSTAQVKLDNATRIELWLSGHKELLQRWEFFISELKTSDPSFTMFAIALRELLDLSRNLMFDNPGQSLTK